MNARVWSGVIVSLVALASTLACDSDRNSPTEPPPVLGSVTFEYLASTEPDPEIRDSFPDCWDQAGMPHLHPSWRDFRDAGLQEQGAELWTLTVDDVPVGREQTVYLTDRNACSATNSTGTVTDNFLANDVRLVRIVDVTVHGGVRQALAFTLSSNGTVVP